MTFLIEIRFLIFNLIKNFQLHYKAKNKIKSNTIIFVPEFTNEGGALTYFKYILEYFHERNISYLLVLSKVEKEIVIGKLKLLNCIEIIDKPEVWRPFFTFKNKLNTNLSLLNNQLQELIFFLKLQIKYQPSTILFSIINPEHYFFEFFLPTKILYVCHTSPADKIDQLKKLILNLNLCSNKNIIAVSNFEKKEMINSWTINENNKKYIIVIHNYYSLPLVVLDKTDSYFSGPIKILTIGSLEYYKNPLKWISIAKKVTKFLDSSKIRFYWIGSGSLYSKCLMDCKDYENIHFEGHQDSVEKYYNNSHIYLQPSKYESFGISAVGAMAHQLPCVVSDAGGLKEIFWNNGSGIIISSENEDDYVNTLLEFIVDKTKRETFGKKGYEIYNKNYMKPNWDFKMDSFLLYNIN